jgi:hypothetical protein
MAAYRLYCLDGVGRIASADWLEALSDEEAVELARGRMGVAPKCEVWLQHRMVAKIDAPDPIDL